MPVLARPPSELQPQQLEGVSSWSDAFKASFQETVATGPFMAMVELGNSVDDTLDITWDGKGGYKRVPRVAKADALQQVKDAGLEGQVPLTDAGIHQDTLTRYIDMNTDKVRRQTLASQYDGWTPQIAGMVAGSIVDPANIALSVIPVVGEARYAQLLKNAGGAFGRFGVRASVGALEGTVGAALAEPFIYAGQQQWRNDYDFYDSALNIVGGAVFGSLLHGGAGLVADRFGVRAGEAHIEAQASELREALTPQVDRQAVDWMRPLDADRAAVEARLAEAAPTTRVEANPPTKTHAQPAALQGEPPIPEGMVRVYHGGVVEPRDIMGEQFASNARERGQGYANKAARDGKLYYLDLPESDPRVAQSYPGEQFDTLDVRISETEARSLRALVPNEAPQPAAAKLVGEEGNPALQLPTDVRTFVASIDQGTQSGSLRMAMAQAFQRQKVDVSPAILSDPMFRQNPAAYAAMREGAMKSAGTVAEADLRASEAATAKLQGVRDEVSLEDARALLADEEAIYREVGGDMDSLDIDVPEGDLTIGAGKGFGLCRLRSDA